jgi:hypothetical protein
MCTRGGLVGAGLLLAVSAIPVSLWWSLHGIARATRSIYIQYIAACWWISLVVNVILQGIIAQPSPHPYCFVGHANPPFGVQQLVQYMVQISMHRLYCKERIPIGSFTYEITVTSGMSVLYWWSGNFSVFQIACGALTGALLGLILSLLLYVFFVDRFFALLDTKIVGRMCGYYCSSSVDESTLIYLEWCKEQNHSVAFADPNRVVL